MANIRMQLKELLYLPLTLTLSPRKRVERGYEDKSPAGGDTSVRAEEWKGEIRIQAQGWRGDISIRAQGCRGDKE